MGQKLPSNQAQAASTCLTQKRLCDLTALEVSILRGYAQSRGYLDRVARILDPLNRLYSNNNQGDTRLVREIFDVNGWR